MHPAGYTHSLTVAALLKVNHYPGLVLCDIGPCFETIEAFGSQQRERSDTFDMPILHLVHLLQLTITNPWTFAAVAVWLVVIMLGVQLPSWAIWTLLILTISDSV